MPGFFMVLIGPGRFGLIWNTMQSNESSIRIRNLVISLATVVALALLASTYAEPVLRISMIPDEPPFVVKRKIKPLTEYLEQKIGMKVEFRPMRDSDALVDSLLARELDLVWIDGSHLVQARSRSNDGIMPIVQRAEDGLSIPESEIAPPHSTYSWAVRSGLDSDLREKLTDTFLTMHTDRGKGSEILGLQHASRFIPISAEYYSAIEAAEHRAGQTPRQPP